MNGRQTMQCYVQKYRGDYIWQQDNNDNIDVRYVNFLYKEQFKRYIDNRVATQNMLKKVEHKRIKLDFYKMALEEKEIVREYKKRR